MVARIKRMAQDVCLIMDHINVFLHPKTNSKMSKFKPNHEPDHECLIVSHTDPDCPPDLPGLSSIVAATSCAMIPNASIQIYDSTSQWQHQRFLPPRAGGQPPRRTAPVKGLRKRETERVTTEAQQRPQCRIMNQAAAHNSVGR
ncbi:hypothetical protein ACLKA6_003513 [Drosophila palustris]